MKKLAKSVSTKISLKEVASLEISAYFDIFNKLITSFERFDNRKADLVYGIENQVKNIPQDVISAYGKGYGSQILPFLTICMAQNILSD